MNAQEIAEGSTKLWMQVQPDLVKNCPTRFTNSTQFMCYGFVAAYRILNERFTVSFRSLLEGSVDIKEEIMRQAQALDWLSLELRAMNNDHATMLLKELEGRLNDGTKTQVEV